MDVISITMAKYLRKPTAKGSSPCLNFRHNWGNIQFIYKWLAPRVLEFGLWLSSYLTHHCYVIEKLRFAILYNLYMYIGRTLAAPGLQLFVSEKGLRVLGRRAQRGGLKIMIFLVVAQTNGNLTINNGTTGWWFGTCFIFHNNDMG